MKLKRQNGPDIIIGKRVVLGQIVGAMCAWGFWIAEAFYEVAVPAAMVTQMTTLLVGLAQLIIVNWTGRVTTYEDE